MPPIGAERGRCLRWITVRRWRPGRRPSRCRGEYEATPAVALKAISPQRHRGHRGLQGKGDSLGVREEITAYFRIPSSRHLRPLLNHEILTVTQCGSLWPLCLCGENPCRAPPRSRPMAVASVASRETDHRGRQIRPARKRRGGARGTSKSGSTEAIVIPTPISPGAGRPARPGPGSRAWPAPTGSREPGSLAR